MVGVDAGWAGPTDDRWHTGAIDFPAGQEDPDGGEWLLELLLDDSPEAYRRFAEENYELKSVDPATVSEVYALRPLTRPLVTILNGQLSVADLAHDPIPDRLAVAAATGRLRSTQASAAGVLMWSGLSMRRFAW
jgi:hypothetical protein